MIFSEVSHNIVHVLIVINHSGIHGFVVILSWGGKSIFYNDKILNGIFRSFS